ncbi:MAG: QueT transporter family protein [Clostridia bacterium]|nr:QueT transporter family protein [Clostridia bacterium]
MQNKIQTLTRAGLIAAVYVVLTLVIQPIGYGTVQFRVSELLTVLPVYMPEAIPGLAIGCFVSNLVGLSIGANPAGGWDLLIGTGATVVAAALTYRLRGIRFKNLPVLATLPPVIVNAIAIGVELALVYGGVPWYVHMLGVAAGQILACSVCGTVLAAALNKVKTL